MKRDFLMTDQISVPVLLYVEDEPVIRLVMTGVLEEAGFELIVASNGEQALDILAAEYDRIDGLVTDVDLGRGPTGWMIARRARTLIARIPVLYASSVSQLDWLTNGVPLSRLVAKPYRPSRIIDMIRSLLTPLQGANDQIRYGAPDSSPGAPGDVRSTLLARRAAIARISRPRAVLRPEWVSWA